MNRKYVHHHGKIFWEVIIQDDSGFEGIKQIVVKTNCPSYKGKIYPVADLTLCRRMANWIEKQPSSQFPLIVRSILQGFDRSRHTTGHWFTFAKEIYDGIQAGRIK